MKVVAAYLLALLGGNSSPSADDVKDILESVGCDVDDVKIEVLLTLLKGKDITELIASGRTKLASVPCSGAAAATVAEAVAATIGAAESKKEESVEERGIRWIKFLPIILILPSLTMLIILF